jgi:hypothetical protein
LQNLQFHKSQVEGLWKEPSLALVVELVLEAVQILLGEKKEK